MLKVSWKIAFPVVAALIGLYVLFAQILSDLGSESKEGLFWFMVLSFIIGVMTVTVLVIGLLDLFMELKDHRKSRRNRR